MKNLSSCMVRNSENCERNLHVFINLCLGTILRMTTNKDLWERARQRPGEQELRYRRCRWLGHTLRCPRESITRQALSWNSHGKRKKSRPRNTWGREMEPEIKRTRRTWKDLEKMALNTRAWKDVLVDLCLQGAFFLSFFFLAFAS